MAAKASLAPSSHQMIPEHRSAEFFGFIGFFGKIATLTGPWIYVAVDQISDPRTAIFSILSLVVMGLILLQFVDVGTPPNSQRKRAVSLKSIDSGRVPPRRATGSVQ